MKNSLFTLLFLLVFGTGYSQEPQPQFWFEVHSAQRPVTKQRLIAARTMSELSAGYPTSWVSDYVSIELVTTHNGKVNKAKGTSETLNLEQLNLLSNIELGSDLLIDVSYNYQNAATGVNYVGNMTYTVTVVPETEAQFIGGEKQLKQYLQTTAIDKVSGQPTVFKGATVKFTIAANGEVVNARLTRRSNEPKRDMILLEAITNMPKWKPAVTSMGNKVTQDFEFTVDFGSPGC